MKIFDALSNAGEAGLSAEQLAAHIDADPQLVCEYLVRLKICPSRKLMFSQSAYSESTRRLKYYW